MRFTPVILAGLMAVVKAQDETTSAAAAPTSGLSSEVEECISSCAADDVNCIAHCTPVPSPDEGNLEALHDCVGECDQGSGSEADTIAYGNCVQTCVVENYYDPEIGTPGQGQSGGSGSGSDSDSGDDSSEGGDSSDGGDDSEGGDSEGGDSNSEGGDDSEGGDSEGEDSGDDDSAATGLIASPLVALFGVAAAVLAF